MELSDPEKNRISEEEGVRIGVRERHGKSAAEMIGEFLREMGVLIVVFVPIVIGLERDQPLQHEITVGMIWVFAGLVLASAGMLIEIKRTKDQK